MRDVALQAVYGKYPEAKAQVDEGLGYAIFKNFGLHPGLLSFASGYGVVHDKARNHDTYVDWHRLTIGPGIAVKGLYGLVVFHDQELMEKFESGKWACGGQAEASFLFGDFGGAAEAGWLFTKKADVYYRTYRGVALEIEFFGVGRVSNDEDLNEPAASAPSN